MRIPKNGADIVSGIADHANRQLLNILDSLAESKKQKEIQTHATEIAGNYGKAIAQIASNTTPVQKTATEGAGELSELEKFFAKLEAKGKKTIKIGKEGDEIDVILYRGKHNDYIKSDGKIFRVRYST